MVVCCTLLCLSDRELGGLRKELKRSKRAAFAEGTSKNLKVQWESYLLFCKYFHFKPLPTTEEILALFAQFLSRSFKSVESIRNYVGGVRTLHKMLSLDCPETTFHLRLSLKGIEKISAHCPNRMQPITPAILCKIADILEFSNPEHACLWCLFLFAFFLFARKSNLVPDCMSDISKCLLRKHVSRTGDNLEVSFFWTKTIQARERVLRLPLLKTDSVLCPVTAYDRMISLIKVPCDAPLFSLSPSVAITYSKFQKQLRVLLGKVGEIPEHFGTHSFRRGGATIAFQAGASADIIKAQGDWKSDAYQKYIEFSLTDKLKVASLIHDFINL